MALIKFNSEKFLDQYIEVSLSLDYFGRVIISFNNNDVPENSILTSGFIEINEHNFIEQADYSNMINLYRQIDEKTFVLAQDQEDIYSETSTDI